MSGEFELVKVTTPRQLHENLEKLLKNKKHIVSITVDTTDGEVRVDLDKMANAFGKSDFRMKLKKDKTNDASALVDRLRNQDAPTYSQSELLFNMLEVR